MPKSTNKSGHINTPEPVRGSAVKTAPRSVQPFLHSWLVWHTNMQTTLRATSVATGCILSGWSGWKTIIFLAGYLTMCRVHLNRWEYMNWPGFVWTVTQFVPWSRGWIMMLTKLNWLCNMRAHNVVHELQTGCSITASN